MITLQSRLVVARSAEQCFANCWLATAVVDPQLHAYFLVPPRRCRQTTMATSMDDCLQRALKATRDNFVLNLPAGLSEDGAQQRWEAYLVSSSRSTAPSSTQTHTEATVPSKETVTAPLSMAVAPQSKRRRLVGVARCHIKSNTNAAAEYRPLATPQQRASISTALVALPSRPCRQASR